MPKLIQEQRKYPRYSHTPAESSRLRSRGFTPVISSNVSAIARDDLTLFVRFHGGATYGYPKSGKLFDDMLGSASKGKFVWNELRRKNVPYYKTSNVNIPDDVEDKDMMKKDAMKKRSERKPEGSILAGLTLATMVSSEMALEQGIIAGLALAQMINANEAEN